MPATAMFGLLVALLLAVQCPSGAAGQMALVTPSRIMHVGIDAYEAAMAVTWANSYADNTEMGFAVSGNDDFLVVGGGRAATTKNTILVYPMNATSGTYANEHSATIFQGFNIGATVHATEDKPWFLAYGESTDAYLYQSNNVGHTTFSYKDVGTDGAAKCVAGFPCDSIGVSADGKYAIQGWPSNIASTGVTTQNGFMRYFTCGTTCNSLPNAWPDGSTNSATAFARGRDANSVFGASAAISESPSECPLSLPNRCMIVVGGAPGNTAQANGPELAYLSGAFDFGGNNGDYRYGGYVQVARHAQGTKIYIQQRIWAPDGNTPAAVDNMFGGIVKLSADGSRLVVSAPGTPAPPGSDPGGVGPLGAFYVYANDGSDFFELSHGPIYSPGPAGERFGWAMDLDPTGDRLFVGAPDAMNGDGAVYVFNYYPQIDDWRAQPVAFVDAEHGNGAGYALGGSMWYDASRQQLWAGSPRGRTYLDASHAGRMNMFDVPPPPTLAPTPAPTDAPTPAPVPQCEVTADCPTGKNCLGSGCVDPEPCETWRDCSGTLNPGRLPFCTKGLCLDRFASDCETDAQCEMDVTKRRASEKGVGSVRQSIYAASSAVRDAAAANTVAQLRAASAPELSDAMVVVVEAEDRMIIDADTVEAAGGIDALMESVRQLRCANASAVCRVGSANDGGARRRQLATTFDITVSFSVTDDVFEQIKNGLPFDDPAFLQSIADELGVDPSDISLTADAGTIEIIVTVTDDGSDEEPVDADALNAIKEVQASLTDVARAVAESTDGLDLDDITTQAVDLCGERDCNGFGADLCDAATGVCDCPPGNWGINCDAQVSCTNNGTARGSYCDCAFPYYGLRCQLLQTACGC